MWSIAPWCALIKHQLLSYDICDGRPHACWALVQIPGSKLLEFEKQERQYKKAARDAQEVDEGPSLHRAPSTKRNRGSL